MFSKSCEYAIRAVIYIAQKSRKGAKVGIPEIAQGIDGPVHFVAKILQELARAGLVLSVKGPNGGFYMDVACEKKTLADVVRVMDGDQLFKGCALGLKQCSEKTPCPIHDQFKAVREQIRGLMQSTTIGAFSEASDKAIGFLKR